MTNVTIMSKEVPTHNVVIITLLSIGIFIIR
jgi:hypothetical protein